MSFTLRDPAATGMLASRLAESLPDDLRGWTLLLDGELGAGKSTFARAFIHALGHDGAVPSPTYTLVEPYEVERGPVYHIDLYRIGGEDELHFLGWDELDAGCRLVEWPSRAPSLAKTADLRVELAYDGDGRTARLVALSPRAADVVGRVAVDPKT